MTDFDPWILAPDDEFETALKRKRKDNRPFYLCLRARARLEQGLAGEAREILQRALELAHPNPRDYYRQAIETELARLDIAEGDDRNAEEIFRRILSADSSYGGLDGLAGVELAELLAKRGALGEAADWLTKW